MDNALNDEQKKAWKAEGFDAALARRSGMPTFRLRGNADAAPGATTGTIEIVTTEVRRTDGSDD